MADNAMLSVREVALRLGIRTHGVLTLIHSEAIRSVDCSLKPGGRPLWRIDPEELENFILRRTHQTVPLVVHTKQMTPVAPYPSAPLDVRFRGHGDQVRGCRALEAYH